MSDVPILSVIIPALDEAECLPGLLDSLAAQDRRPDEVIVADAGSTDGTAEIAAARGALVVPGGRPAAGRNAGAGAARGDLFLFLDADVVPGTVQVKLPSPGVEETMVVHEVPLFKEYSIFT